MSNNGNIMGVELNLNQEYIKASVEEIVKAGIIGALGDPADIVKSALDKTLNRKVDKDGKDTSYIWGTPYLQYMANKAVEKAVQECMQKYVGEHEEEFRQEILRQLSSKTFRRDMAAAFIQSITKASQDRWKMPITVTFEPLKNEDY